ncbi:hypothetical protein BDZ91DRAFT_747408 [Kalaharituber pfeilii]|nr:hypothetical protein BDZ91DRAFT_747408 [Kalaharituber pfeilii]
MQHSIFKMTQAEAEKRLGFRMQEISPVPVQPMLAEAKYEVTDSVLNTKKEVYKEIMKYLDVEDFPTSADEDVKDSGINDLVYSIISTILFDVRCGAGLKKMKLRREKDITTVDSETGGSGEFMVMDYISVADEKFIRAIEAKRY